ncbi:hypothetical protein [Bradyrhizobium sp. SZCCHNRI1073]|nr:hypothetical protein [Bradyrhizobium sp. SZCCHNRI1073]
MTEQEKAELLKRIYALEQKVEKLLADRQLGLEIAAANTRRTIGLP